MIAMLRAIALSALLWATVLLTPAHADRFMYDVEGSLTLTGPPSRATACGGVPCVQQIDYNFHLTYQPYESPGVPPGVYAPHLSAVHVTSTGPLGAFSLGGFGVGYLPFRNGADEIDLYSGYRNYWGNNTWSTTTPWVAPIFADTAILYRCQTEACQSSFNIGEWRWFDGVASTTVTGLGTANANASLAPTRVPEPMTLLMVGIGVVGLVAARRARWI
jgi:PEP-CTERM motif